VKDEERSMMRTGVEGRWGRDEDRRMRVRGSAEERMRTGG